MLKSIHLKNFFSFKDIAIELNPSVNILIGINGSGKSNLLKAFTILKEGIGNNRLPEIINEWGGYDKIVYNGGNAHPKELGIEILFDDSTSTVFSYKLEIKQLPGHPYFQISEYFGETETNIELLKYESGKVLAFDEVDQKYIEFENKDSYRSIIHSISDPNRYKTLNVLRDIFGSWSLFGDFFTGKGSKMRYPQYSSFEERLAGDGGNLTPLLQSIKINDNPNYEQILKSLSNINPEFEGLDFYNIAGSIELYLKEHRLKRLVPVTHISDGTLKFLCLLSIFYNQKSGGLICIDEPENGLHPDMIRTICRAIEDYASKAQVIIATHSENILNNFNLENIRVFEKDERNETTVSALSESEFKGWYDKFFPGEMWRAGDLGGNRW